ncbi:hypothetical protein IIC68_03610 [archaeon]|nr:hypothetical protein [archaeon]
MSSFEGKVRQVGTSLGVLIPKEIISKGKIKKNQIITLAVIEKDLTAIDRAFGSAPNTKPFKRDHKDRVF